MDPLLAGRISGRASGTAASSCIAWQRYANAMTRSSSRSSRHAGVEAVVLLSLLLLLVVVVVVGSSSLSSSSSRSATGYHFIHVLTSRWLTC